MTSSVIFEYVLEAKFAQLQSEITRFFFVIFYISFYDPVCATLIIALY